MKLFISRFAVLAILCLIQWASGSPAGTVKKGLYANDTKSTSTVRFNLTLTWEDHEVAGSTRKVILSNGQFPGPALELKQGDDVEFNVVNQLPFATTIHFHGIEQTGTPWSDGVPGLSQYSIKSGDQFLYKWTAGQYGTYWYHAHTKGQMEDGLVGPIYIQPDDSVERPFHLITNSTAELLSIYEAEKQTRPVMIHDWRVLTSEEVWEAEEATGLDGFCVNAILINGKGSVQCLSRATINENETPAQKQVLGTQELTDLACAPPVTADQGDFPRNVSAGPRGFFYGCTPSQGPTEVFEVNPEDGWVSWDLISSAGLSMLTFSIDEHPMYVYAADGRYIQPLKVDAVTVANGVRYSVMVKLDKPAGDYTVRVANNGFNQIINGTAIMSYTGIKTLSRSSEPYITITGTNATETAVTLDESQVVPFPVEVPSLDADQTFFLHIDHYNASYRWILGNTSFPYDITSTPLLLNRSSIPQDMTISTLNGTWVDLIFLVTNPLQPPHPIHKHSNKYFVIGQGTGTFNYSSVAEARKYIPESFNFQNPQIRDTFITQPVATASAPTWLALRYQVVNPGPFLLHCHIQVHLSGGMAVALLDGVDAWPQVPPGYAIPGLEN